MDQHALMAAAAIGAAAAAAGVIALLLRLARCPGGAPAAALLGGCVAGLLLGPGVLGRTAPDAYTALYRGDTAQRAQALEVQRRHEADLRALAAVGASPPAFDELRIEHEAELAPLLRAADGAADKRAAALGGALLGAFLAFAVAASLSQRRTGAGGASGGGAGAGVAACVVTIGITGLCAALLLNVPVREALALACVCAVGGVWLDTRALRSRAGRARGVWEACAGCALAGCAALVLAAPGAGTVTLLVCAGIGVVAKRRYDLSARTRRFALLAATGVAAPAVTALVVVRLDPAALAGDTTFWLGALIAVVLCHDGRWTGAWLGWRTGTGDRTTAWRSSAMVLDANTGLVQTAAAGVLLSAGAISPALAGAGVVGALGLELAAPLRNAAARWMDKLW